MKNGFRLISSLLVMSFFFSLYAVPAPFMNPGMYDRNSPTAASLAMGGSFGNIWADDVHAMWANPAALGFFVHENHFGITMNNMDWNDPFATGAIAGGLGLGNNMSLGLGFSNVFWNYDREDYEALNKYSGISAAFSWHSVVNASIGIMDKMFYNAYPDTAFISANNLDIGVIVEWPAFASRNKGDLTLMGHAMHFDITPGFYYTFKNIGANMPDDHYVGASLNISLFDKDEGYDVIHAKYSYDVLERVKMNGLQIGLYDIFFIRYGTFKTGSVLMNSSGYGINYTRLISILMGAFKMDKEKIGLFSQLSIEQHWGEWQREGSEYAKGYSFMLKWQSK